jgi:hypothetical protein
VIKRSASVRIAPAQTRERKGAQRAIRRRRIHRRADAVVVAVAVVRLLLFDGRWRSLHFAGIRPANSRQGKEHNSLSDSNLQAIHLTDGLETAIQPFLNAE